LLRGQVQDAFEAKPPAAPGTFLLSLPSEGYRLLVSEPRPAPGDVAGIFDRVLEALPRDREGEGS